MELRDAVSAAWLTPKMPAALYLLVKPFGTLRDEKTATHLNYLTGRLTPTYV